MSSAKPVLVEPKSPEKGETVPRLLSTRADRVFAVTKQLQTHLRDIVKDPTAQVISVSGSACSIGFAITGGVLGLAGGSATGFTIGMVPAIFTLGLSLPVGATIGGTVGAGAGAVLGAGTGLVGGGVVGGVAYAYRLQIKNGAVVITAKVKDVTNNVTAKASEIRTDIVSKTKTSAQFARDAVRSCTREVGTKALEMKDGAKSRSLAIAAGTKCIASEKQTQVTVVTAAGGAAVGGTCGGFVGLGAGTMVGGAIGIVPALFTFGLSIPVGAAIGGGTGLFVGTVGGSSAGAATGGAVGYGAYAKREKIDSAAKSVQKKAGNLFQYVKDKKRQGH